MFCVVGFLFVFCFFAIGAIFKTPLLFSSRLKSTVSVRFKSESFSKAASQWGRRHTKGSGSKHTKQKRTGHRVLPTQSAKSQTAQAPCDITEESAMFCCRTTSRLQRRKRPASRSSLSGFLAQSHLAGYLGDEGAAQHFISWPQRGPPCSERRAPSLTAPLAVM